MFVIHVHSEINKRETFFFERLDVDIIKGEIYIFDVMQTIRRLEVHGECFRIHVFLHAKFYTPHTLSYNTVRSNIKFFRYLTTKA